MRSVRLVRLVAGAGAACSGGLWLVRAKAIFSESVSLETPLVCWICGLRDLVKIERDVGRPAGSVLRIDRSEPVTCSGSVVLFSGAGGGSSNSGSLVGTVSGTAGPVGIGSPMSSCGF